MVYTKKETLIKVVQESIPDLDRDEVPDDHILLRFSLYKYIGSYLSGTVHPIYWYARMLEEEKEFWVDLTEIKQIPSDYRREWRSSLLEILSTTNVPKDKHALAMEMLFEAVDKAANPHLPINVNIFDVTVHHNRKTIPATRQSIERLERVRIDSLKLEDGETCAICWREYDRGSRNQLIEYVSRLPCSHYFHGGCIVKWLQVNHVCPLCRFAMPTGKCASHPSVFSLKSF